MDVDVGQRRSHQSLPFFIGASSPLFLRFQIALDSATAQTGPKPSEDGLDSSATETARERTPRCIVHGARRAAIPTDCPDNAGRETAPDRAPSALELPVNGEARRDRKSFLSGYTYFCL